MKDLNRIDSEISRKNYENDLVLCQKAGGDIERYRRLSFDVLQLEQIRIGLEKGLDVEKYLDSDGDDQRSHGKWCRSGETKGRGV